MSYTETIEAASSSPDVPADNPFLPALQTVVDLLADGTDHPEVWSALADAASQEDVGSVRDLVALLLPVQAGQTRRSLEIVAAMLHALSIDHAQGLGMLGDLAARDTHCAQTAGAFFFVHRAFDTDRNADLSDRFCEAPFVKFETLIDGTVAPCCSLWTDKRLGNLDSQSFEQIWNSRDAQDMRASILDGSYRYCNKQRCTSITEDTLPLRSDVTDPQLRAIIDEGLTEMTSSPRWLFLAHDVTCNLACPSCRDGILAADEAQEARFDIIERDVLRPMLDADGKVLVSICGQGDPWSSPHYRSILRYMADHALEEIELDIHTNALLMGPQRWAQYAGLDRYRALVNVSIDACTPWTYRSVRRPGKWEKLYPNLEFIAAKRANGEFREFHLNATIQLDNFHEMPGLVDLASELGADSVRMYMMQNTGDHIAGSFDRMNVGGLDHPLHLAFLETLRDPKLGTSIAHLYDVATWRERALHTQLPSDTLGADYSRDALADAIASARGSVRAALCAAGRIRFPDDLLLLLIEARTLKDLGFDAQAGYRLSEMQARGGAAITLG